MDRLLQIGFRSVGRWELQDGELRLHLEKLPIHESALYAFATGTTVLYVGKTAGVLPRRLAGYLSPHPTQRTNVRNHASLRQLLGAGHAVEIYGWIAYSTAIRPAIPRETGHPFHGNPATDSTAIRPPIPWQSGHPFHGNPAT